MDNDKYILLFFPEHGLKSKIVYKSNIDAPKWIRPEEKLQVEMLHIEDIGLQREIGPSGILITSDVEQPTSDVQTACVVT